MFNSSNIKIVNASTNIFLSCLFAAHIYIVMRGGWAAIKSIYGRWIEQCVGIRDRSGAHRYETRQHTSAVLNEAIKKFAN